MFCGQNFHHRHAVHIDCADGRLTFVRFELRAKPKIFTVHGPKLVELNAIEEKTNSAQIIHSNISDLAMI